MRTDGANARLLASDTSAGRLPARRLRRWISPFGPNGPRGCAPMVLSCVGAAAIQAFAFFATPVVNLIYDGWPRGWLIHLLSVLAAFAGGVWPGLTAEAVGVGLIWWKGKYFTPMHPGLEVFAAIGVLQVLIIHRLQVTHRTLIRRQVALETAWRDAERAQRLAEQASSARDKFLGTLSHELRTPLTVILGYSQLVQARSLPPDEYRRIAAVIERSARQQVHLVEDLFDIQRILSGDFELRPHAVDLRALAASVAEALRPVADERRVSVATELGPVTLRADGERLRQVIWNLLSNAIKFSPEGGRVRLIVCQENSHAMVRVENAGAPIPGDFLPHLFEPFRQADMSASRQRGGLGLGLAIAKHVVELHGGSIDVRSDRDTTSFAVRLPARDA